MAVTSPPGSHFSPERTLQARLAQAKANQERAKAEVILAQQRFDRSKPLVEQNVLSQQAVDDAGAALAVAQANQAAADATAAAAAVDLDYATIAAPISGRVGRVMVTTGNVVQANTTHLLTIIDDGILASASMLPATGCNTPNICKQRYAAKPTSLLLSLPEKKPTTQICT